MSGAAKEGLFLFAKAEVVDKVLSADFTTDALDTRHCSSGSVWLTWTDASAATGAVKLQQAATELGPWEDLASATATISAAGPLAKRIPVSNVDSPYLRAVATKNTETTAKVTLRYYFKGVH